MIRIILVCILLALPLVAGCGSFFFYPDRVIRDNLAAQLLLPEDVFFDAADGVRLHGWYFRAQEPTGSVLVLHGNAENLSTHVNSVLWMVLEGFNVFIIDYRGYGRSEGRPSVRGVHRDAEAALGKLLELPGVDGERVAIVGQSVGGAVAIYTVANSAHRQHLRAVVIDSAFAGYRRIVWEKLGGFWFTWPLRFLVGDRYSPERWIAKIAPIPLLLLHGREDTVVPFHHGELLFAGAGEPKTFIETDSPGHVRSFGDGNVRKTVAAFLQRAFGGERTAATAQLTNVEK